MAEHLLDARPIRGALPLRSGLPADGEDGRGRLCRRIVGRHAGDRGVELPGVLGPRPLNGHACAAQGMRAGHAVRPSPRDQRRHRAVERAAPRADAHGERGHSPRERLLRRQTRTAGVSRLPGRRRWRGRMEGALPHMAPFLRVEGERGRARSMERQGFRRRVRRLLCIPRCLVQHTARRADPPRVVLRRQRARRGRP